MADIRALITQAHKPERVVSICLRGDLVAEYERLEGDLIEANRRDAESFSGGESRAIVEKMDALRAEMTDSTVLFRLRALDKMRPLTLLAEHPPREDDENDKALGYNQETYYSALVRESVAALEHADGTVLEASKIREKEWNGLLDVLSHKQFDNLVGAALILNNKDVDVPFSHLASLVSQVSEGDSE